MLELDLEDDGSPLSEEDSVGLRESYSLTNAVLEPGPRDIIKGAVAIQGPIMNAALISLALLLTPESAAAGLGRAALSPPSPRKSTPASDTIDPLFLPMRARALAKSAAIPTLTWTTVPGVGA